ncbi:hypothetical protein FQA39_LY16393 [Lamprigera yunnana]|nr:hypothetical protein FQA39_LY16393 [Lamprigera yunnana]
MKLLILSLCLNVVSSILTVPKENDSVKLCVEEIIKNAVPLDTTVLYVYDKTFDDVLPDKLQHPFLTFDISKMAHTVSGYKSYNEMIILNLKSAKLLKKYFEKMRQHVWKSKSSASRKYLIISSSDDVSELKEIFLHFLEFDVDDVIIITHNSTLEKKAIKVFTWNPYHPSNKCGTIFNVRKEESCSSIKMIENRRKVKNFNKCNLTYFYDSSRRYKRYSTEVAYVTRYFLEILSETLNVTIVPLSKNWKGYDGFYIRMHRLESCSLNFPCTVPFLRNGYIWTVPPPKRIHPMVVFKIVYKTFVWIVILLAFLFTSIIWWFISYCKRSTDFTSALLNVYSLTLFGFINKIPTFLPLRVIFIAYVIYAIHIQSIFMSNLVKMLTIPQYEPTINNLEELAASDLPILIDNYNIALFKAKGQNNSLYSKLTNKYRMVSFDEGIHAIRNQTALEHNSVFIVFDVLYDLVHDYIPKLHTVVDSTLIGAERRTFLTKAESSYLSTVNNIVNIYLESGLINLKQMEYKRYINKFAHYYDNKLNTTEGNVVFCLNHVYSVFVCWALGLTVATVIFIIEKTITEGNSCICTLGGNLGCKLRCLLEFEKLSYGYCDDNDECQCKEKPKKMKE